MWRYALPGIAVVAALVVVLATAVNVSTRPPALAPGAVRHVPAKPPIPGSTPIDVSADHAAAGALAPVAAAGGQHDTLAAQSRKLQAQMEALTAQAAQESKSLDALHAQTEEARQQLAALQARGTPRQGTPGAGFSTVQGVVSRLRHEAAQPPAPAARARSAAAPPSDPAPSMEYWLRTAQRDLAIGDTARARQVIEAVQTRLVFQPGTPDDPAPGQDNNVTATQLGQALAFLDAGETERAKRVLDRAIEGN